MIKKFFKNRTETEVILFVLACYLALILFAPSGFFVDWFKV